MSAAPEYYKWVRTELLDLLPREAALERVLDVGCGSGATGEYLKNHYNAHYVVGIEKNPEAARTAREKLDAVIIGNAEDPFLPIESSPFDLVLMGDILEHLVDPWQTLARYKDCLQPQGILLASIPNIQHWRTVGRLLRGHWTYQDGGTLDRTHLRFFTRKSIRHLFAQAGLKIDTLRFKMGPEVKLFNLLTLGLFRDFLAYQYLILARR